MRIAFCIALLFLSSSTALASPASTGAPLSPAPSSVPSDDPKGIQLGNNNYTADIAIPSGGGSYNVNSTVNQVFLGDDEAPYFWDETDGRYEAANGKWFKVYKCSPNCNVLHFEDSEGNIGHVNKSSGGNH